ncbi:MAG TPA: archaeosortase/exosortase family protein, partial [Candidatus Acidoferrum sp.]|nr:archaeosortase/exosortase family protein [Candidatus Acidoferrum sp.]
MSTRGSPTEVSLAQELNLRKASNIVKWAALALLFILTFLPAFADLHVKYSEIDSYYSHGHLVPLVSLFVIWHKRKELKSMKALPSRAGLWVLGGSLLLYLFGRWWYVNFVSDLSILVVLAGLSLSLFGTAVTRKLMFP